MRRLLILGCAVVFLDASFFAILTPLLPSYRSELGLSDSGAGLLAGSFAAGTLVMALPSGYLAARFGARRAVLAGLIGIGVFSPLFGFANDYWVLIACRFMQGMAGAMMWAGAISWVVSAAPLARRGEMIGSVIAAAVVGDLLGAPLGAVAHHVGTEPVFGSVFIAAAVLFAVAWTIPNVAETERQSLTEAIDRIKGSKVPRGILVLAAPSIAFGLIIVVAPLRMDDLGASPTLIAAAFAAGSVVEGIIGPVIGRYSDRSGRKAPYLLGLAMLMIAITGIGVFEVLPLISLAVVLSAFGAGLSFTPGSAIVTDSATEAGVDQGYASGASNVGWGGGQMVGALGGGFLASLSGYLLPCLLVVAILGVMARVAKIMPEPQPVREVEAALE